MPRTLLKVRGSRPLLKKREGAYFLAPHIECISSGCKLLDCVLGGGYPLGRVSNVVGDRSTGKTLLAIEACANFARTYPTGDIAYAESEAAFDSEYASALGMPLERVQFAKDLSTVEEWFDHINDWLDNKKGSNPGLYILDSLDALSDRAELDRKITDSSYGASKPKQLSQAFRRLVRKLEKKRVHLMIISQVRDNIGVSFGEKHTRSGGRALDFYASQILWLAQMGTVKKVINKVQRVIGVTVRARCKKNKIGLSHRECTFNIKFGYGVDDIQAGLEYLKEHNRLSMVGLRGSPMEMHRYMQDLDKITIKEYARRRDTVEQAVEATWRQVEKTFLPARRKYN